MTKKPLFWILLSILSLFGLFFTIHYFSSAFPVVNVDIQMNRQQALENAQSLAQRYNWGPSAAKSAVSYTLDDHAQSYVELETGGAESFSRLLAGGLYSPSTWKVRLFQENTKNEVHIFFTPEGQFYGFDESLPEAQPGAALASDSARAIAENTAMQEFGVNLPDFELIEQTEQIQIGDRMDHSFIYERPDTTLGAARFRLQLQVSGDKLTKIRYSLKIPEAFDRKYEEMRSLNDTIATIAMVAMLLLYGVLGIGLGLFYLMRQRWLLWKKALFWGAFIAALQAINLINEWPLSWMGYDTAISTGTFFFRQILNVLLTFIAETVLLSLSFIAAESLTRRAFPQQLQLWKIWRSDIAATPSVAGRTIGGYLAVSLFFAFDVAVYLFASTYFGWWSPSSELFEPNILATYLPWFSSIAISLHAGFWEECLFRAIPIAGAALLGEKFGKKKLWIIGAFIIQALIFGSGHANYPAQPAWARPVELFIPSIGFGLIYLYFGLLPAIILHFIFDVVWFALPLFAASSPGIWLDRTLLTFFALVPIFIILLNRQRHKSVKIVPPDAYNSAFEPEKLRSYKTDDAISSQEADQGVVRALAILGLIGLGFWSTFSSFENTAPKMQVTQKQAVQLADSLLAAQGFELGDDWLQMAAFEEPNDLDDKFVWQTLGDSLYNDLLGVHILPPRWHIRYAKFSGNIAERAEEFNIYITDKNTVQRFYHPLPEARAGAILSQEQAQQLVDSTLINLYDLSSNELERISIKPEIRRSLDSSAAHIRTDWIFTFADTVHFHLKEGQARVVVKLSGDQVTDAYRSLYVPEEWEREMRHKESLFRNIDITLQIFLIIAIIALFITSIVNWAKGKFNPGIFLIFSIILLVVYVLNALLNINSMTILFSTAQPLKTQQGILIISILLGPLFIAGAFSILLGWVQAWRIKNALEAPHYAAAVGFGALYLGIFTLLNHFAPTLVPPWANYSNWGTKIPVLAEGLSCVSSFIRTILLYLVIFAIIDRITAVWTKRKAIAVLILFAASLITLDISTIQNIPVWLIFAIIKTLIIWVGYVFLFRFYFNIIPVAFAVPVVFGCMEKIIINPTPASIPGALIGVLLISALAVLTERLLRNKNISTHSNQSL